MKAEPVSAGVEVVMVWLIGSVVAHGQGRGERREQGAGYRVLPTSSPLVLIEYQIAFIAILIYVQCWESVMKVLANS